MVRDSTVLAVEEVELVLGNTGVAGSAPARCMTPILPLTLREGRRFPVSKEDQGARIWRCALDGLPAEDALIRQSLKGSADALYVFRSHEKD